MRGTKTSALDPDKKASTIGAISLATLPEKGCAMGRQPCPNPTGTERGRAWPASLRSRTAVTEYHVREKDRRSAGGLLWILTRRQRGSFKVRNFLGNVAPHRRVLAVGGRQVPLMPNQPPMR